MSSAAPQDPISTTIGNYEVVEKKSVSPTEWNNPVTEFPGGGHFFQSYEWSKPHPDEFSEDHPLYGVYKSKAGFGGAVADLVDCYDLPVKLRNRMEPIYYRLRRRVKGDFYY